MYHITPDGPKPCTATIGTCKYGKPVSHFDNISDAQRFYEKRMFEENGHIVSATKKSLSARKAAQSKELTGKEKAIADLKAFKQKQKHKNLEQDFIKKHDHMIYPINEPEKTRVRKMRKILNAF